jgi:S1-C subfamily serine protease
MGRPVLVSLVVLAACASGGMPRGSHGARFIPSAALRDAVTYVQGCGTGWMVTDQFVVTNRHVAECVKYHYNGRAQVIFSSGFHVMGEIFSEAEGKYVDLAIIRLGYRVNIRALQLARGGEQVRRDDLVLSIGNPAPSRWVPTSYRVVAQPRELPGGLDGIIVMEGFAIHGDSGSPVVTLDGRVVGVLFARSRGHAFAIPIRPYLTELLQDLPRPSSQFSNKNELYTFW